MSKTIDDPAGLVSIGELARSAGVTSRTIRYYEELGILPEPRRSAGGTRKYPTEYGGYIAAALALKDLGFRLDEIKPLARLALGRPVSASQRDSGGPAGGEPDRGAGPAGDGPAAAARLGAGTGRGHAGVGHPGRGQPGQPGRRRILSPGTPVPV